MKHLSAQTIPGTTKVKYFRDGKLVSDKLDREHLPGQLRTARALDSEINRFVKALDAYGWAELRVF